MPLRREIWSDLLSFSVECFVVFFIVSWHRKYHENATVNCVLNCAKWNRTFSVILFCFKSYWFFAILAVVFLKILSGNRKSSIVFVYIWRKKNCFWPNINFRSHTNSIGTKWLFRITFKFIRNISNWSLNYSIRIDNWFVFYHWTVKIDFDWEIAEVFKMLQHVYRRYNDTARTYLQITRLCQALFELSS